ncbi:MAG: hypothetical protein Q9166_005750 [cf. Caloplaca sp. 2 TL-2023]
MHPSQTSNLYGSHKRKQSPRIESDTKDGNQAKKAKRDFPDRLTNDLTEDEDSADAEIIDDDKVDDNETTNESEIDDADAETETHADKRTTSGAKKPWTPPSSGSFVDIKKETVGEGDYRETFSVKLVDKPPSDFWKEHYKRIPNSQEVTNHFHREAENYPVIRESIVVKCTDKKTPLLHFIKQGMFAGLSSEDRLRKPNQTAGEGRLTRCGRRQK